MQKAALVYLPKLRTEEDHCGEECFSFPPSSRLLKPAEYKNIFKGGKRISSRGLTLLFKPNGLNVSRLGMTVPKRLVKKAVGRNAIKRRIRESFRLNQHKLGAVDIVIMANSGISKLSSNQQVFELINPLWAKVSTLK